MSYFDDVWQRTVTVVERDKEPRPVLYRSDGTPLAPVPKKVGFDAPKPKARESNKCQD